MRAGKTVRSFVCLAVCILVCFGSFTAAQAAPATAQIDIASKYYAASSQKYVNATEFDLANTEQHTVYIPVSVQTNSTVGGFGFTLRYDENVLQYAEAASLLLVKDSGAKITAHKGENSVTVLWETVSENSVYMKGEIYYAAFVINPALKVGTDTAVEFSLHQLFDGTSQQNDIKATSVTARAAFTVKVLRLQSSELAPFEKLVNITYPDSQADIIAAKAAYTALGSTKQQQLHSDYPALYEAYSTAQSRYNRLAEAAAEQQVRDELAAYIATHAPVWKLTVDTVQLSDAARVNDAVNDQKALSARAQSLLDKKYSGLLQALQTVLETLAESTQEISDYKAAYDHLSGLTEKDIAEDYASYNTMLDEALLVYDMLSDRTKTALAPMADTFKKYKRSCETYLEKDKAAQAVAEKVAAFQKQWLSVLMLNANTVSAADETAIRMMLSAYNEQEDSVKSALAARMASFDGLLLLIAGMQPGGIQTEPEIIVQPGTNTHTTSTVTQTVVQTVTEEKDRLVYKTKSSPWFLIVLLVLLFISLVSLALPFVLRWREKSKAKPQIEDISSGEEIE